MFHRARKPPPNRELDWPVNPVEPMAKQNLSEQLDRIVDALVARRRAASSRRETKVGAKLQALATIATQLRDLPAQDFKARLKLDLERRTSMASKPVSATE